MSGLARAQAAFDEQWPRDEHGRFAPLDPTAGQTIRSYWDDPQPIEAEQQARRDQANAVIDTAVRPKLIAAGLIDEDEK